MSQYVPEGNSVGIAISKPRIELKPLQTSILAISRDYMSQYAPRGNSVGVVISQPRVEVRSASTLGITPTLLATLQELRLAEGVTINLPKWRLYFPYKIRIMSLSTHSSPDKR